MQPDPSEKNKQHVQQPIDYPQTVGEQIDCSQPVEQQEDCEQPVDQEEDCEQNAPDKSTSTKTVLKWVSILQIVVGILSVICGIVQLCFPSSHSYRGLSHIGYGIWIGLLIVMAGVLGIIASRKGSAVVRLCSPCTSVITLMLSIVLLAFTSIGLSEIMEYKKRCNVNSCPSKEVYDTFVAMYSIHILIALTNFVATICVSCLRCRSYCRRAIQVNIEQQQRAKDQQAQITNNALEMQARYLETLSHSPGAPGVFGGLGAPGAPGAFGGAFGGPRAPGVPGSFGGPGAPAAPGVFETPAAFAAYGPYQYQQQYSPYSAGAIPQPVGHMNAPPAPPSYSSLVQSEAVSSAPQSEVVPNPGYTQHSPVSPLVDPEPTKH